MINYWWIVCVKVRHSLTVRAFASVEAKHEG